MQMRTNANDLYVRHKNTQGRILHIYRLGLSFNKYLLRFGRYSTDTESTWHTTNSTEEVMEAVLRCRRYCANTECTSHILQLFLWHIPSVI